MTSKVCVSLVQGYGSTLTEISLHIWSPQKLRRKKILHHTLQMLQFEFVFWHSFDSQPGCLQLYLNLHFLRCESLWVSQVFSDNVSYLWHACSFLESMIYVRDFQGSDPATYFSPHQMMVKCLLPHPLLQLFCLLFSAPDGSGFFIFYLMFHRNVLYTAVFPSYFNSCV